MSKQLETIFGLSALLVCSAVALATPWPTADALFSTHASPPLNNANVQVQISNSQ